MNKLTLTILTIMILAMHANAATVSQKLEDSSKLHGDILLRDDEEQIARLNAKLEELKSTGNNGSVIQAYIDLAKEMKELNNERHALHQAVRSFEKAVGIFSEKIKIIIQKVNVILATQAEVAINNSKVAALLQPKTVDLAGAGDSEESKGNKGKQK